MASGSLQSITTPTTGVISNDDLKRIWHWNSTAPDAWDACVHDLISATAQRQPDATAIDAWDGRFTYGQLDELSAQLASQLISLGVGPEVIVPLCFEKSRWMSIAVIAVMKASGASVMLDPSLPEQRLQNIVEQVRPIIILSSAAQKDLAEKLSGEITVKTVEEDTITRTTMHHAEQIAAGRPTAGSYNSLYLVFTSGSTGAPKGAIMTHRNFASAFKHQAKLMALDKESRVFDFSSYSFDMAYYNVLHTLYSGACLCIPSEAQRRQDPSGCIRSMQCNFATLTPTVAGLLDDDALNRLDTLELMGEASPAHLQNRLKTHRHVRSMYGPAETTAIMSASEVDFTLGYGTGAVMWVVDIDDSDKLAPVGSVGELWIEGPLVCRGYLNDKEKTAAAFINDPIWLLRGGPGHQGRSGRLYRSGDLARYNDNGTLSFAGRKDNQVKIRGQRVELGEIEHHVFRLLAEDGNADGAEIAVEVLTPSGQDRPALVAFVVPATSESLSKEELLAEVRRITETHDERLAAVLPPYMLPSGYIPLAVAPLTANGKIDRRKLREIGAALTTKEISAFAASQMVDRPSEGPEKHLAELWASVLAVDVDEITTVDSFLRLGGDSILAMRLVAAARQSGISLTVADVLSTPRLSEQALKLSFSKAEEQNVLPFSLLTESTDEYSVRQQAAVLCDISAQSIKDIYPCSPLQEGLLAMTAKKAGHYVAKLTYELAPQIDLERFKKAWSEMVESTQVLQTRIVDLLGHGLVQVLINETPSWPNDIRGSANSDPEDENGMGLGTPLCRTALCRDETSDKLIFTLSLHHAMYDGWSLPLLLDALERAYEQSAVDKVTPFQPFIRYIRGQSELASDAFWSDQLDGSSAVQFPTLPVPSYQPHANAQIKGIIPDFSKSLFKDFTAATTIRAAWALLQARYTDSDEAAFGVVSSGRQAPISGIEQMAAPTIATIPARVVVDRTVTVEQFLGRIQAQALETTPHEQAGLQRIRRLNDGAEQCCRFQTLLIVQPGSDELPERKTNILRPRRADDAQAETNEYGVFNTYALMIQCRLESSGLHMDLSYDSNVIDEAQMRRILAQFEHILRQLANANNAQKAVGGITAASIGDIKEIQRMNQHIWKAEEACLHEIVATTSQRFPNKPAVCAWDGNFTYTELDGLSTQLAHRLAHLRVKPGVIVPIYLEKTKWTPVSMLGVMKTGAAFVTLTPSMAQGRLDAVIKSVKPKVVITTSDHSRLFPDIFTFAPDEMEQEEGCGYYMGHPHERWPASASLVTPSHPAAVLFTSGSTGTPKGIVLAHRCIATAVHYIGKMTSADRSTRVFQFASYLFDVSLYDTILAFTYGGCLCIPSQLDRDNDTGGAITKLKPNWTTMTPSVTNTIIPDSVPTLKTLIWSGEALKEEHVVRWGDKVNMYNWYGPAECALCTMTPVQPGIWKTGMLGHGYSSTCWIVERDNPDRLAAFGAIGELLVEGPGVAIGYLGDAEKTAASFVQDPSFLSQMGSADKQRRVYRTGDLVRYQSDGTLVYVGRKDAQVKIRGQRVELQDIEYHVRAALTAYQNIEVVVDVIRPAGSPIDVLTAFLKVEGHGQTTEEITARLAEHLEASLTDVLPAYMVPTAYIPVRTIPIAATGKTDRRQLRAIGNAMSLDNLAALDQARSARRPPTTKTELQLRALWAQVLGIDTSSIYAEDNFLRIGGDSIAAMRFVAAARSRHLTVTVADLFKYPRLCDLAGLVQETTEQTIIEISPFSLLKSHEGSEAQREAARLCGLEPDRIQDVFPCTPLQAGLLALTAQRDGQYVERLVIRLQESIDVGQFRRAWEDVAAMTPILRTRIIDLEHEGLVQVVVTGSIQWLHGSSVEEYLRADKQKRVDLGTALTRFALITEQDSGDVSFVWTIHHALYDGWSRQLILSMVEKAYQGEALEAQPPFQEYIRSLLAIDQQQAGDIWRAEFDGMEAQPFPRLPSSAYKPRAQEEVMHQVNHLQWPRNEVTPATAIRTALSLLLGQYTGSEDVLFGATVTGRQASISGIDRMTGPTLATIPVRTMLNYQEPLKQLLSRIQQAAVDKAEIEHVGLQWIRRLSNYAEQACDFQTLLMIQPVLEKGSPSRLFEKSTEADALGAFNSHALLVACELEDEGLRLTVNFDADVIACSQIKRMTRQLEHVLRQICDPENGDKALKELDLTSEEDLADVWTWNTAVPASTQLCIHDLIADVAERQPNALAVCGWDGEFTYSELDSLSTRLAQHLCGLGVGPEVVVPLCFDKSTWMSVAVLAVMKAGGVALAMDTKQPEERLRTIAQQAKPIVILFGSSTKKLAQRLADCPAVTVDRSSLESLGPESSPLPQSSPDQGLYVIFTSGTTGTPKGIIITHSNFASAIASQQEWHGFTNKTRTLDFASYAFDVFWYNSLMTWTAGGCLCTPSATQRIDDLTGFVKQYGVSYAHVTPSVARAVDFSTVETLNVGGEALSMSDLQQLDKRVNVLQTYGPAECTVTSTGQQIDRKAQCTPSIGRGLGAAIWILSTSQHDCLAPVGGVGEICIEGPLVGRGYLGDPERTAAAFIESPAWLLDGTPGSSGRRGRVYRTGDLGRYNLDGSLSFVGRRDGQVKVRGQRVELGDVEHHLQQLLRDRNSSGGQVIAEVITPKDRDRSTLVAFIVPDGAASMTEKELRAKVTVMTSGLSDDLATIVPVYMIPDAYLPLAQVPTTASGKTDRRRLRYEAESVALVTTNSEDAVVEPSNDIEATLRDVWAQVLNLPSATVSTDASFTRLGGDSITAMQVVSRCRARNIKVTVTDVLGLQTVHRVAQRSTTISQPAALVSEVKENDVEADRRGWILSPIQQMYFDMHVDGPKRFNQSFVLKVNRPVQAEALSLAIRAIVSRHTMLRARFRRTDEEIWSQYAVPSAENSPACAEHELSDLREAEALMQSRQRTLDVEQGPVFAADLMHVNGTTDQYLLLSAHHLVIDLVSWRIIWYDLQQVLEGKTLEAPPTSFRTWCTFQREASRSLTLSDTLPEPPEPPRFDYWGIGKGANQFRHYDSHVERLSTEITSSLLGTANDALRTSTLDILLAVLVRTFQSVFKDRKPVPIFLEGHGREEHDEWDRDLAETVGWFTTVYPLQLRTGTEASIVDAVREAKDVRKRVPGNGRPYLASRYHSDVDHDPITGGGEIEVMFNFLGQFQQLENEASLFTQLDARVDLQEIEGDTQMFGLIDISVGVANGQMEIEFLVNRQLEHQSKIQEWIRRYAADLAQVASQLEAAPHKLSLTDFPLLHKSYAGLDHLIEEQLPNMGIPSSDVADIYPCTPLQEGILLSTSTGSATYATYWIWTCTVKNGDQDLPISVERLIQAWQKTAEKHLVFSTIFVQDQETGGFAQVIRRSAKPKIQNITAGNFSPGETLKHLPAPSFNRDESPVSVSIAQANNSGVALRLDMNHALGDAASMALIAQSLQTAYAGHDLPPTAQFREAVEHIQGTPKAERLKYWANFLDRARPCIFPTEVSSRTKASEAPKYIDLPVELPDSSRLSGFCKEKGITRATFLQAVWALVLSQYTGADEICFGFLASGRDMPIDGIHEMVGPLINMLVSRVNLRGTTSNILAKVGHDTIQNLSHQHVSLAEVHQAIGQGKLFNTSVTVRDAYEHKPSSDGLQMIDYDASDAHEFDIGLSAGLNGSETLLSLNFRLDKISYSTAKTVASVTQRAMQYLMEQELEQSHETSEESASLRTHLFKTIVGADVEEADAFWARQFSGLEATVFPELPAPNYQPHSDSVEEYIINGITLPHEKISSETAMCAAWALLQTQHTASAEALFGLPTKSDRAIILPRRVLIDRNETVKQYILRIQAQSSDIQLYERTVTQRIQRLGEDCEQAYQFQTLLHIQEGDSQFPTLGSNHHALVIQFITEGTNLHIRAEFDTAVLAADLVLRMLHQFEHILRQLVDLGFSETRVHNIETASPDDLNDVWRWNEEVPAAADTTVHHVIRHAIQTNSTRPAICAWDGELTYRELDDLSNRLAANLSSLGAGPEVQIPLCFEKSMWTAVAMLGILKSGAACVALDVTQPEERLRSIVSQVTPSIIVSSEQNTALAAALYNNHSVVVVSFGSLSNMPIADQRATSKQPIAVKPENAAYVGFTSGSTGVPKGVVITHSNLASLLVRHDTLDFKSDSRVYDFASYAFDVCYYNAFMTLAAGGCVCVPSEHERKNDLSGSLVRYRANHVTLTSTVADTLDPSVVRGLRSIELGGEAVSESQIERLSQLTRVRVAYGPVECTIGVAWRSQGDQGIGRGIGSCTWIVDPSSPDRLAPIGAVGELWIEGPLVGRGYLGPDQAKTQAVFVEDPPWLRGGTVGHRGRRGRLYKTGDLVRYAPGYDGSIAFVGRKDTQVKIRGQRVELGEVAHHVLNHLDTIDEEEPRADSPTQNNVVSNEGMKVVADFVTLKGVSRPCLVAFISPRGAKQMTERTLTGKVATLTRDLHKRMVAHVPSYMVPSACFPLPAIPTTSTGKADHRRLQAICSSLSIEQLIGLVGGRSQELERRHPSTAIERQLQKLWADILRKRPDEIGLEDNFLQLGGDSIQAMRLVAAAQKEGLAMTVPDVFLDSSLGELAKHVKVGSRQSDAVAPYSLLYPGSSIDKSRAQAARFCGISKERIQDMLPCTSLQEGLLAMTAKRTGDYTALFLHQLRSELDLFKFKSAWEEVVATTPILRTRIVDVPGIGLTQVVVDQPVNWLEYTDRFEVTTRRSQIAMGLGTPLCQVGVCTEANSNKRYFVCAIHHALYDGWMMSLVLDALKNAYRGHTGWNLAPFSPFIERLRHSHSDSAQAFWKNQFVNLQAQRFPSLPSVEHQPQADVTVDHSIKGLGKPLPGYTMSTTIRAAWAMLVASYTNTPEVVFGTVVTGRQATIADVERMAGPTVATVPVRIALNEEATVEKLLRDIQLQALDMTSFEQTGLQNIQKFSPEAFEACQFQSVLVVQGSASLSEADEVPDIFVSDLSADIATTASDNGAFSTHAISLICEQNGDNLQLLFTLDSAVVSYQEAKRMAGQLEHILRQLCAPEFTYAPLSQIKVLGDNDLHDIWRWNADLPASAEECVHDLFAQAALTTPDAQAISSWDGNMSYKELDGLSSNLAFDLIGQGVGPGMVVPLVFEKSKYTPLAMLAVMKAGGASVALDVTQPQQRLQAIVNQVQAPVILSSRGQAPLAADLSRASTHVVVHDNYLKGMTTRQAERLATKAKPEDPVYLAFTSGSTGEPKGVIITHNNLTSLLLHSRTHLEFSAKSRVFDFASYAFDVSWYNAFQTLTAGGCLCIPSEHQRRNELSASILDMGCNCITLTPTVAETLDSAVLQQLDWLELGGEAVSELVVERFSAHTRVRVAYGPVECTIGVAWAWKDRKEAGLGYAVGSRLWVVSPSNQDCLVPVGCVGELYIEGPLVGRGYLNNEQRTSTSFVHDPPWLIQGSAKCPDRRGRLYKTGDLVKYNEDGSLTFIGRKDTQVKIRGQRVELGEVEHHVLGQLNEEPMNAQRGAERPQQPEETQVLADVINTSEENSRSLLVAFVAPRAGIAMSTEELATKVSQLTAGIDGRLAAKVPACMIPTAYIPIANVPIAPTGKADRRRLRDAAAALSMDELRSFSQTQAVARRPVAAGLETRLQSLWANVLDLSAHSISADDSFFRIGGDSIQAMRLVAAAQHAGFAFTVADVFKHQILGDLAKHMRSNSGSASSHVEPFSLLAPYMDPEEVCNQAATACRVETHQIEDVLPCTPLQEGLLALTAQKSSSYVANHVLEILPDVDVERLKEAWALVVSATPILRTRIIDLPGHGLVQAIIKEGTQWLDLKEKDGMEQQRPTEMLGSQLSRLGLWTDNQTGRRYILWSIHHALYDGWSMSLVFGSVKDAYFEGSALELSPFQPFIRYLKTSNGTHPEDFWRQQFSNLCAQQFPLLPSAEYQPRADATFKHAINNLTAAPGDFTLATTIRAAWAILITGYTGSSEAVFGAVITGRQANVPAIDRMCGPTIATVPVRIFADPIRKQSVQDFLKGVQKQSVDMIAYEQTGLQNIQRLSTEAEEACRFQSLLSINAAEQRNRSSDDRRIFSDDRADDEDGAGPVDAFSNYALTLACQQSKGHLNLVFSVDTSIVQPESVRRMAHQFEHILRQLLDPANAQTKLSRFQTLSQADLQSIWDWNAMVPETAIHCVHEVVSRTIRKQPNAQAIEAWDGTLTYGQVGDLSDRLAARLVQSGVKAETVVPLAMEKSLWTPVAMLAVMKAGGALLALDVTQPEDRLRSIVARTGPKVIMSSASTSGMAAGLYKCPVLVVDSTVASLPLRPRSEPEPSVALDNAVYLAFTSGSTGEPKGVTITHSNLATLLLHNHTLEFDQDSRVFDFASYAFDVAIYNVSQTFSAGGCLCIPSEHERRNDLSATIRRLRTTNLTVTPTVADTIDPVVIKSVKILELGGEAVSESLIERMSALTRVRIAYGPVECTIGVAWARKDQGEQGIGRGIGATLWVADQNSSDRLVGIGCIGELLIEGPLVGRGYLDAPEKTAASFVEDPPWLLEGLSGARPGRRGRLYKTGDLVKLEDDGTLTFVGRKDTQVKIRGQRVELGEVEHHVLNSLNQAGDVSFDELVMGDSVQVVVDMVKLRDMSQTALVAFVVPKGAKAMTDSDLTAAVTGLTSGLYNRMIGKLPSYMVPVVCIPLKAIPTSTTGKSDRRRLRELCTSLSMDQAIDLAASQQQHRRAPSTGSERQLQQLWASVLNIDPETINAEDSFFRLGGDSIQAMRLVSRAQRQNISLTVTDVLSRPVLQDLAHCLSSHSDSEQSRPDRFCLLVKDDPKKFVEQEILPVLPRVLSEIDDVLPISHAQRDFLDGSIRGTPTGIHHFYVDLPTFVDQDRLVDACSRLVQHFEILRTVFVRMSEDYYQVVLKHATVAVKVCRVANVSTKDMEAFCHEDNDTSPPSFMNFLRLTLLHDPSGRKRLIIRISHAQYDGMGFNRILSSLSDLYQNKQLPSEPSISQFIHHQRQTLSFTHWNHLLHSSTMTKLRNQPLSANTSNPSTINTVIRTIPLPTPSSPSITPATLFTSAVALTIARLTSSIDVLFGRLLSGRSSLPPRLRDIVFPTITTLPVRVRLPSAVSIAEQDAAGADGVVNQQTGETGIPAGIPAETPADVLKQVHEQHLAALQYESLGERDLVEKCKSWPKGEREFGVRAQWQALGETMATGTKQEGRQDLGGADSEQRLVEGTLGDLKVEHYKAVGNEEVRSDTVLVVGTPKGKELEVRILAKSTVADEGYLERAMGVLVEELARLGA